MDFNKRPKSFVWTVIAVFIIIAALGALYLLANQTGPTHATVIRTGSGTVSVVANKSGMVDNGDVVDHARAAHAHGAFEAAVANPSIAAPSSSVSINNGRQPLLGVTTFQELESNLRSRPRDERLHMLWKAGSVCESHQSLGAKKRFATGGQGDWLDDFCQSYLGDANAYLHKMQELPAGSELIQAQSLSSIANTAKGRADAIIVAKQMVQSTSQPGVLKLAGWYLANTGTWEVGAGFAASAGSTVQLQEAQRLAVNMVACRLSGGCGAGAWTTMLLCRGLHRCAPNITAYDVWRYKYSPQVYDLAQRIEEQLLEERADYQ